MFNDLDLFDKIFGSGCSPEELFKKVKTDSVGPISLSDYAKNHFINFAIIFLLKEYGSQSQENSKKINELLNDWKHISINNFSKEVELILDKYRLDEKAIEQITGLNKSNYEDKVKLIIYEICESIRDNLQ